MKKLYSITALAISCLGFSQTYNYQLVTNDSQLTNNAEYIITGTKNGTLTLLNTQNSNNRKATPTNISASENSMPSTLTQEELSGYTFATLTFEHSENYWLIKDGEGYLYAAGTGNNNHLKTSPLTNISDDREKWEITFNNNIINVKSITSATTRNILKYNNGSNIFSCYSNGQQSIFVYKKIEIASTEEPTANFSAENLQPFTYIVDNGPSNTQTVDVTVANLPEGNTATLSLDNAHFAIESATSLENGTHTITLKLNAGLATGQYTATLSILNGTNVLSTLPLTGEVTENPLANTKNPIQGLNIYPNPATDTVAITSNSNAIKSVKLYDTTGKEVMNVETTSTINVSHLAKGIYIIKISQEGKTATSKLLVK